MEYAAKAVESSGTAVGVRCKDGVVLGFEKLIISKMLVEVYSQTSCPPRSSRPALSGRLFPAARVLQASIGLFEGSFDSGAQSSGEGRFCGQHGGRRDTGLKIDQFAFGAV